MSIFNCSKQPSAEVRLSEGMPLSSFFLFLLSFISHVGEYGVISAEHTQETVVNEDGISYSALSFGDTTINKRYIILLISRLGLANRLRSIADWHQIALLSDRSLLVGWQANADCNALFTDLFESVPKGIRVLPFQLPAGENEAKQLLSDMATTENLTSISINETNMWAVGKQSFVLDRKDVMSDIEVCIVGLLRT